MDGREAQFDWVCGLPVEPNRASDIRLRDPNTGEPSDPQLVAEAESVERALACAADIHRRGLWSKVSGEERASVLEQIARLLEGQVDRLARLGAATTGVVISQTEGFAALTPKLFRMAAELARADEPGVLPGPHGAVEVRGLPLGPALCIAPWNAPTVIGAHKVASALAAGCPTILKPSEWAPQTAQVLAEAIHRSDLPPGTFQLLHGTGVVGATLTADPRIRSVSFTGGLQGGRAVAVSCARDLKPAQLELGGNNPLVVLEDADVELAAAGVVAALTPLNGQWCRALGRLLVHRSLEAQLLEALEARLSALKMGPSTDHASEMGPLIHHGHLDAVQGGIHQLCSGGGAVRRWTSAPEGGGAYCPPTLVTGCAPEASTNEIFGPVAAVHGFDSEEEMFRLVHQAPYGLAAYVYGDEERALGWARQFEIGSTKVNGVSVTSLNPGAPRSAWRLSGLGLEGHRETFEFFRGIGVVGVAGVRS